MQWAGAEEVYVVINYIGGTVHATLLGPDREMRPPKLSFRLLVVHLRRFGTLFWGRLASVPATVGLIAPPSLTKSLL
jgi:hypothetical protein